MPILETVRALLLDIEGTTTPISFVYETLFPFARRRLVDTCRQIDTGSPIEAAIERLRAEYSVEKDGGEKDLPEFGTGAAYAEFLMDRDRKSTGLKLLQGLIWEEGYRAGELRGEVFEDVPNALQRWKAAGRVIKIYSSGSVHAQKLLFAHSSSGDLTPYLDGYHDTTTGPKKEASSYRAIAEAFDLSGDSILFLSDVVDELDAAAEAGMRTGLLRRPGNHPVGEHIHPVYRSFEEL